MAKREKKHSLLLLWEPTSHWSKKFHHRLQVTFLQSLTCKYVSSWSVLSPWCNVG